MPLIALGTFSGIHSSLLLGIHFYHPLPTSWWGTLRATSFFGITGEIIYKDLLAFLSQLGKPVPQLGLLDLLFMDIESLIIICSKAGKSNNGTNSSHAQT